MARELLSANHPFPINTHDMFTTQELGICRKITSIGLAFVWINWDEYGDHFPRHRIGSGFDLLPELILCFWCDMSNLLFVVSPEVFDWIDPVSMALGR